MSILHLLDMVILFLEFHLILGQCYRLMFNLKLAIVNPYRDRLARQSRFSTEPPIMQLHIPMPIQRASVARGEQNAIEDGCGIHLATVPAQDLQRGMATVLAGFVSPHGPG